MYYSDFHRSDSNGGHFIYLNEIRPVDNYYSIYRR